MGPSCGGFTCSFAPFKLLSTIHVTRSDRPCANSELSTLACTRNVGVGVASGVAPTAGLEEAWESPAEASAPPAGAAESAELCECLPSSIDSATDATCAAAAWLAASAAAVKAVAAVAAPPRSAGRRRRGIRAVRIVGARRSGIRRLDGGKPSVRGCRCVIRRRRATRCTGHGQLSGARRGTLSARGARQSRIGIAVSCRIRIGSRWSIARAPHRRIARRRAAGRLHGAFAGRGRCRRNRPRCRGGGRRRRAGRV